MLDLKIFGICQIFNMEELFNLFNTFGRQVYHFVLLIDNEVSAFFYLFFHNGCHLGKFAAFGSLYQLSGQYIAHFIKFCRLSALSRNDQRCSRLIDQHRVNLIHNSKVQSSLYKLLFIDYHVVS